VVIVLLALGVFVVGQRLAIGDAPLTSTGESGTPFSAGDGAAANLGAMSPEEAASRLFDRVMRYWGEGKLDSAAFFAPMALMSYEQLGPPDAHARYDIGMIHTAAGDAAAASAQADTILKAQPNHLLGLLLAARAAEARKDAAAAARYRARMAAAAPAERAKQLREYADHQRDIDEALNKPTVSR
jgi:hypothetical protein